MPDSHINTRQDRLSWHRGIGVSLICLATASQLCAGDTPVQPQWLPLGIETATREFAATSGVGGGEGYTERVKSGLAEARRRYWKTFPDKPGHETARRDFAFALMRRDGLMLATATLSKSSKEFGRKAGSWQGEMLGMIGDEVMRRDTVGPPNPGSGAAFNNWVRRSRNGKTPFGALAIGRSAYLDHYDAYRAYAMARDRYEFRLAGRESDFFPTDESFAFYMASVGWINRGAIYDGNGVRKPQEAVRAVRGLESAFGKTDFWRAVGRLRAASKTDGGGLASPLQLGLPIGQTHLGKALLAVLVGDHPEKWVRAVLYKGGADVEEKFNDLVSRYGRTLIVEAASKVIAAKRTRENPEILTSAAAAEIGVFDNRYEHGAFLEVLRRSGGPASSAGRLVRVPAKMDGVTFFNESTGRTVAGLGADGEFLAALVYQKSTRTGGTLRHELLVFDRATKRLVHRVAVTPPDGLSLIPQLVVRNGTAVVYQPHFKQRPRDARLPPHLLRSTVVGCVVAVDLATGERGPWLIGKMQRDGPYFRPSGFAVSVATNGRLVAVSTKDSLGRHPDQRHARLYGRVKVYRTDTSQATYTVDAQPSDYGSDPSKNIDFGEKMAIGNRYGAIGLAYKGRSQGPACVVFDARDGRRVGVVPRFAEEGRIQAMAIHEDRLLVITEERPVDGRSSDRLPVAYLVSLPEGRTLWRSPAGVDWTNQQFATLDARRAAFFDGDQIKTLDAATGEELSAVSLIVKRPPPQETLNRELQPKTFVATGGSVGFYTGWNSELGWVVDVSKPAGE